MAINNPSPLKAHLKQQGREAMEWTKEKCVRFPRLCKLAKGAGYLSLAYSLYSAGHKVGRYDERNKPIK